jgi:hypothetical protein
VELQGESQRHAALMTLLRMGIIQRTTPFTGSLVKTDQHECLSFTSSKQATMFH